MTKAWISPRALAAATGVSTDTLRHYERLGLLSGVARTTNRYRRYRPDQVERVQMIQLALVVGFSLRDLARALRRRDSASPPCQQVRALVATRMVDLEQQVDELACLRDALRGLLAAWDQRLAQTNTGQPARLLDMLLNAEGLRQATPRRRLAPASARISQ